MTETGWPVDSFFFAFSAGGSWAAHRMGCCQMGS